MRTTFRLIANGRLLYTVRVRPGFTARSLIVELYPRRHRRPLQMTTQVLGPNEGHRTAVARALLAMSHTPEGGVALRLAHAHKDLGAWLRMPPTPRPNRETVAPVNKPTTQPKPVFSPKPQPEVPLIVRAAQGTQPPPQAQAEQTVTVTLTASQAKTLLSLLEEAAAKEAPTVGSEVPQSGGSIVLRKTQLARVSH